MTLIIEHFDISPHCFWNKDFSSFSEIWNQCYAAYKIQWVHMWLWTKTNLNRTSRSFRINQSISQQSLRSIPRPNCQIIDVFHNPFCWPLISLWPRRWETKCCWKSIGIHGQSVAMWNWQRSVSESMDNRTTSIWHCLTEEKISRDIWNRQSNPQWVRICIQIWMHFNIFINSLGINQRERG